MVDFDKYGRDGFATDFHSWMSQFDGINTHTAAQAA
jgi:hypothetical protein